MGVYNCGEGSGLENEENECYSEMVEEDDNIRIPGNCERDCQPQDQHFMLLTIFNLLTIILSIVTIVLLICSIR